MAKKNPSTPESAQELEALLAQAGYIADPALSLIVFLGMKLARPILLEGEAGVGKTELARALAHGTGRRLVRLQCYEGLDVSDALYSWDYAAQMMEIRLAESTDSLRSKTLKHDIYSREFLNSRPLLEAISSCEPHAPVLLIDELDRTDAAFEAFLLELLADYQVTIPQIGTVRATTPPLVIITSNRTRELHDALKRRCFYHWLDFPDADRERAIIEERLPNIHTSLSKDVVAYIRRLRLEDIYKAPGIAESLDWSRVLHALERETIDEEVIDRTLGVILKNQEDIDKVRNGLSNAILSRMRENP